MQDAGYEVPRSHLLEIVWKFGLGSHPGLRKLPIGGQVALFWRLCTIHDRSREAL
jgi:hypothetical protein